MRTWNILILLGILNIQIACNTLRSSKKSRPDIPTSQTPKPVTDKTKQNIHKNNQQPSLDLTDNRNRPHTSSPDPSQQPSDIALPIIRGQLTSDDFTVVITNLTPISNNDDDEELNLDPHTLHGAINTTTKWQIELKDNYNRPFFSRLIVPVVTGEGLQYNKVFSVNDKHIYHMNNYFTYPGTTNVIFRVALKSACTRCHSIHDVAKSETTKINVPVIIARGENKRPADIVICRFLTTNPHIIGPLDTNISDQNSSSYLVRLKRHKSNCL
ncbi:MAG: hypothetical protein OXC44_04875 [Proteobacteria bacterium]|nr:hypothetical protein [Pseudomonadota bacterium]